jgi:hypothetical protein
MSDDTSPEGGRIEELSRDECLELLGQHVVGRLGWHGPDGPTVIPVNYAFDGHKVLVRTATYSSLARQCDDAFVAFEVDRLDETTRTGWSVLIRGRCRLEYLRPTDTGDEADPWAAGRRPLHLTVEPATVNGRRLQS